MNESHLDERLRALRNQPIPPCSESLEANVLRRIRLAKDEESGWLNSLWALTPRPLVAAAIFGVMLASSFTTSVIAMNAQRADKSSEARAALGFDAFSVSLPLPTEHE